MTLTAAVVCLVLGLGPAAEQGSDEPAATDLVPKTATPGAVSFDALPPPPRVSDDARVKRFLGALAGGVVGLGAGLALMPLGDSGACFGGTCAVTFWHGLVGTFAPLFSLTGAWLGFELLGGDGGLITPVVALGPAFLIALALLSVAREMDASTTLSMMPYVIASGAFLAGGAALALDLRARQLSALGGAENWGKATPGRVAVESLVMLLAGSASAAITVMVVGLASFSSLGALLGIVSAAAGTLGVAVAGWGVHRGMKGRGSLLSALTGLGLGWVVSLAGGALYAISQGGFNFSGVRNNAGVVMLIELGIASAVFGPTLAMEWSHTNAVEASLPKFSFSAAPIHQGAMVGAQVRF